MSDRPTDAPTPRRRLARLGVAALLGFGIFAGGCVLLEDRFIYFPSRYPDGDWDPGGEPAIEGERGVTVEDVRFAAEDGTGLHGWWVTPVERREGELAPVEAPQTLLFFHGNAGNLSHRFDMVRRLAEGLPARVLIVDYRGYGRSDDVAPSEAGLYHDAVGAWSHLTEERGVAPGDVVVLGVSLGGAPAAELATRVEPGGLILQSTFTSVPDMAGEVMPLVPGFLLRHRMDTVGKVSRVPCPVLVVHSPADEVIPYAMGRRIFEAAAEPKRFLEVPGAGHNETYLVGGATYLQSLRSFLSLCRGAE